MMHSDILVTLDVDWAPDFAIDDVAELLQERGVRATWFVTHRSPAVDRLEREPELFELGIHPNFIAGSTQGSTPEAVLAHCMNLVPHAASMRTHGQVQSTELLDLVITRTPVRVDVSLFLPRATHLQPVEYLWKGEVFCRIPYFWEDDFDMERPAPTFVLDELLGSAPGLRIFNFHPIHLALNSASMDAYRELKKWCRPLTAPTREAVAPFVEKGPGTRALFIELIDHIASKGRSLRIKDVVARWRNEGRNP
jgi:hypothetical protein